MKKKMSEGKLGRWISIEGSIGAGKSVLHNALVTHLNGNRIDEPVKEWCESGILNLAYSDPLVWNFPAQIHFFTSRIDAFQKGYAAHPDSKYFVSERSPFSDKMFWQTQINLNRVDPKLGPLYFDLWAKWQQLLPIQKPSLFVYVNTDAHTCVDRIKMRSRKEEDDIEYKYMEALQEIHDAIFLDPLGVEMPDGTRVPVLVVQGNLNFKDPIVSDAICKEIEVTVNQL